MSESMGTGKTITDLKSVDAQLRQLYSSLGLDSEDLRGDLMNMIVHDLRNPVTSTILRLDMIESEPESQLTADQRKSLHLAKSNMFKLSEMITNLLEISRFENCKVEAKRVALNVRDLIGSVVKIHATIAEMEGKTIKVTVDPDAAIIACDQYLLERILSNIISNAIKHSSAGGEISIRVLCAEDNGTVLFRIQDFGEGIPAEYHQKIFERFFQIEMRQQGYRSDLGLGLAFCKMAIETLGGSIWVESEPGKGSCFTFLLPDALMIRQAQPDSHS
jgi:signal transduction histidine kinase